MHVSSSEDQDRHSSSDDDNQLMRNLFRTSPSSSEEGEEGEGDVDSTNHHHQTPVLIEGSEWKINTFMGNVQLTQPTTNENISQKIWPAASHLTEFILHFASSRKIDDDRNYDDDTTRIWKTNAKQRKDAIQNLKSILDETDTDVLHILELGAGVGLTGIKLAMELPCKVIETDLPEALSLLKKNIDLNKEKFNLGDGAVTAQQLTWGTDDWISVIHRSLHNQKLLLLASDCVYFPELHLPLEQTIASILSSTPKGSMCLLASCRRWKRDTAFFANLGKKTKDETYGLLCVCIQEVVTRSVDESREVMRIYAVQWLPR